MSTPRPTTASAGLRRHRLGLVRLVVAFLLAVALPGVAIFAAADRVGGFLALDAASAASGTSTGGRFTLTKTASTTSLPATGGSVTYTYTIKNNTTSRLYDAGGTDDKCSPLSYVSGMQNESAGLFGPTYRYIPGGGTATFTCTQTLRQTTTNTATFSFATGYTYDWLTWRYYLTGVESATATEKVTVAFDPWAACSVTTIWGNIGVFNGTATLREYQINADGTVTGTGRTLSGASGSDIAISPDGTKMYVLDGSGTIREYNVSTGALLRTMEPNYQSTWYDVGTTGQNKMNSLSFGADGRLYVGGYNFINYAGGNNNLYAVDVATGTASMVWAGGNRGTGVVPYGYAGDFVTLPDGSLLGLANVAGTSGGNPSKFVIFPMQANGTLGAPQNAGYPTFNGGQLADMWGMTYSGGYLWLAGSDGNWYRSSVLPTLSSTATSTFSTVQVGEPYFSSFWGATGAQEANSACTSAKVTIVKDALTVTGPNASGVYTANYAITVKNTGTTAGVYAPLVDMPQFDPVFTPTGASWTSTGVPTPVTGSATGSGPYQITKVGTSIAAGATHTYNVAITFTWTNTALPAACAGAGTGVFNTVQANPDRVDDACTVVPLPWLSVTKTAGTVTGPNAQGVYQATYTVKVANTGTGATTYGALTDTPGFDSNLTVTGASWTGQSTGTSTGANAFTLAPAGTAIAAGATHTYNVTVTFTYTGTGTVSACVDDTAGKGLYNAVALPSGQEKATTADNDACLPGPTRTSLTLVKKVADRWTSTDQFTVAIAQGATSVASATTTGTDATKSTGAQLVTAGSTYTLTDAAAAGNAALLTNYTSTLSCTNATTGSSTVLPSGTVTTASVTPAAGDVITCTYTNTGKPHPGINVVKTGSATTLTDPGPVTYTYTVTNTGNEPLKTVTVTDDKCSTVTGPAAVSGTQGDLDGDGLLDVTETWIYTCTQTITGTTTNIVTAAGVGNTSNQPVNDTDTWTVTVTNPLVLHIAKLAENCDISKPTCPLTGATFALYSTDPTVAGATPLQSPVPVDPAVTPAGSGFITSALQYDKDYWIVETAAPAGFQLLAQPVKVRLTTTGIQVTSGSPDVTGTKSGVVYTLRVIDQPAAELPKAGGSGPLLPVALGLTLVLGGLGFHRRQYPRMAPRHAAH